MELRLAWEKYLRNIVLILILIIAFFIPNIPWKIIILSFIIPVYRYKKCRLYFIPVIFFMFFFISNAYLKIGSVILYIVLFIPGLKLKIISGIFVLTFFLSSFLNFLPIKKIFPVDEIFKNANDVLSQTNSILDSNIHSSWQLFFQKMFSINSIITFRMLIILSALWILILLFVSGIVKFLPKINKGVIRWPFAIILTSLFSYYNFYGSFSYIYEIFFSLGNTFFFLERSVLGFIIFLLILFFGIKFGSNVWSYFIAKRKIYEKYSEENREKRLSEYYKEMDKELYGQ